MVYNISSGNRFSLGSYINIYVLSENRLKGKINIKYERINAIGKSKVTCKTGKQSGNCERLLLFPLYNLVPLGS